jgi:hypothetical protein
MGDNKKSLNETEPISNERRWDKEIRIPERASLEANQYGPKAKGK